jgi:hypothetical protein
MENLFTDITGGFLLVLSGAAKSIFTEWATNFVKGLFNTKSKAKTLAYLNRIVFAVIIIGLAFIAVPRISNTSRVLIKPDSATTPQPKSDEIVQGIQTVVDEGIELLKSKKEKDSVARSNRAKKLVYQIGNIKDSRKAILGLYRRLESVGSINMGKISVFQISRNSYFLYQNDGYALNQITDSLANFTSKISGTEPNIEIVDLMKYCSLKEKFVETDPFVFKKENVTIPCCNCK